MSSEHDKREPNIQWENRLQDEAAEIREAVNTRWYIFKPPGMTAEDLYQSTVLELIEWGRSQRDEASMPDSNPAALARTIAGRRAIDARRRHGIHTVIWGDPSWSATTATTDESTPTGDLLQQALVVAMGALRPEDQDLLHMRIVQGRLLREIAEVRGTSTSSTATAIERCLRWLRTNLLAMARDDPILRYQIEELWPARPQSSGEATDGPQ